MPTEIPKALSGRCAFRLMPNDSLVGGPSDAWLADAADAFVLRYTWTHPDEGVQTGLLLASAPDADGTVEGALFDTWHQQPGVMRLTGTRSGDLTSLHGVDAEEWGWDVDVARASGEVTMTMRNVVPESALADVPADGPAMSAGPYDVMVARWAERG